MAIGNTLGHGLLAQVRFGDERAGSTLRPVSNALALGYFIKLSQGGIGTSLAYTVIRGNVSPMLIYYTIAPQGDFALNSDSTIVAPDQITYVPRPVVAHTLLATPILQGYAQMVWTYSVLQQQEYAHLLSFYNPLSPVVTVTYPDDLGVWQQRVAVMRPPVYGTASTVVYSNVTLTFTRLSSPIF